MALRADAFSSTTEVIAFTRHLLDGQPTFNSVTRPTIGEIETFINRASGGVNVAIWNAGFNPAVIRANSTAKLDCDEYVTAVAVRSVELTKRAHGYDENMGSVTGGFGGLGAMAPKNFIASRILAWKRMGLTVNNASSEGLVFTGDTAQKDRSDPDNSSREQPLFTRRLFDNAE